MADLYPIQIWWLCSFWCCHWSIKRPWLWRNRTSCQHHPIFVATCIHGYYQFYLRYFHVQHHWWWCRQSYQHKWGMSLQILERVAYRHAWRAQIIKSQRDIHSHPFRPPGRKAIQCKWVLHIKHDKTNAISRFKAWLIAKGFTQIPGQDFHYTFVPIARWDSIRAILSITTINNYELRQIDLKTAYLNGPLDEEIYMRAPPRLDAPFWHLCKGVYGLCQARRQWYLTLHQTYSELKYTWCESDWSMYTRNIDSCVTISATSIDDILLATNSKAASDSATTELNKKFSITGSGNAEWLLGCCITHWRPNCILKVN